MEKTAAPSCELHHTVLLTQFTSPGRGRIHMDVTITLGVWCTEGVPWRWCGFVLFFPAFVFLICFWKQNSSGQKQGLATWDEVWWWFVRLFWKGNKPKCLIFGSEKTEMFSCSSTEDLKKHNHCQSPLQWQSSVLCQVQACCFTCLPVCLVMVRPCRGLSSPKSVTVLVTFLVMLFQLSREGLLTVRGAALSCCVWVTITPLLMYKAFSLMYSGQWLLTRATGSWESWVEPTGQCQVQPVPVVPGMMEREGGWRGA